MIWDAVDRRYEDDSGVPLSAAEVRRHIEEYIEAEQEAVRQEAAGLATGKITVPAFFEFLREKVITWHTAAGLIAYGGEGEMNPERWLRVDEKIDSELAILDNFEEQALSDVT